MPEEKKEKVPVEPVEEVVEEASDESIVIDENFDDSDTEGDVIPGNTLVNDLTEDDDLEAVTTPSDQGDSSTPDQDGADEGESEPDEVDDLIDKATRGQQKRIDKLTAQRSERDDEISSLRDEIDQLKTKVEAPDGDKSYTYAQLDDAYDDAYQKGDTKLMAEIRKHERENIKKELRTEYTSAQNQNKTNVNQINNQWKQVHKTFVAYSDPEQTGEFYPGSHNELNIMKEDSKLFQLSKATYLANPEYQKSPNGLLQAVQEAFNSIIKVRTHKKANNAETDRLRTKVKKLNREKSQGSASGIKPQNTAPKKPKTAKDELDDFVKMRNKNALGFVAQK